MERINTTFTDKNTGVTTDGECYILRDNKDFSEFLNEIKGTDSIRNFAYYMGVDYNLAYSIFKGRRNTSCKVFFDVLDQLGFEVVLVNKFGFYGGLDNEKTGEVTAAKNE